MKNIIITGASSTLGKKIVQKLSAKKNNLFCQINRSNKFIKKSNVNFIKSNFLKQKSVNKFVVQLSKKNKSYDVLIHLPSAKLELKRFYEYKWVEIYNQILIQVKSVHILISNLIKKKKLKKNFMFIVVTSEITKNKTLPKGMMAYSLAKLMLENYFKILKDELLELNVKIIIIRPKMFKSPLFSNLPHFYFKKYLKNNNSNFQSVIKSILKSF